MFSTALLSEIPRRVQGVEDLPVNPAEKILTITAAGTAANKKRICFKRGLVFMTMVFFEYLTGEVYKSAYAKRIITSEKWMLDRPDL
jgi:hypothetical protein